MKQKDVYLESIRGVAALVVVVHHLVMAFVPVLKAPLHGMEGGPWWFWALQGSPLAVLMNGTFSVRLFFVLSGFVLSISYFKKRQVVGLGSMAVRRYPRLMIPVLASVMASWTLLEVHAYCNGPAAALMQPGGSWLADWAPRPYGFFEALGQGLYGTFFAFDPKDTLNGVLWSMPVELAGSFLVFAFLALFGSLRWRAAIYVVVALVLARVSPHLLDFVAGMALCDWRMNAAREKVLPAPLAWTMLIMGLALGGVSVDLFTYYTHHAAHLAVHWPTVASLLIVGAAAFCPHTQTALQHPVLAFLGRISFQLYLYHLMILYSLGCGTYIWLRDDSLSHAASAWLAALVTMAVSIFVAWGAYHAVDQPAIRLGYRLAKWFGVPGTNQPVR